MGLVISGNVTMEKPFFSSLTNLGTVIAGISATIHRVYLDSFVNLDQLQAQFPQRVAIANDMVSLTGPVVITQSPIILKGSLAVVIMGSAVLSFLLISNLPLFSVKKVPNQVTDETSLARTVTTNVWLQRARWTLSTASAIGIAYLVYSFAKPALAIDTAGVHFF